MKPTLPREIGNYYWSLSYSMSIDRKAYAKKDELCIYLVAKLFMKGEKYNLITINTLHLYHTSKLGYSREHPRLLKMMVKESIEHANIILQKAEGRSEYKGFLIPMPDEKNLDEWAAWRNSESHIYRPVHPEEDKIIPVLSTNQKQEYLDKISELVKWIDDFDDREKNLKIQSDRTEYWQKYAEWLKLYHVMFEYKMIARNNLVFTLINILEKMKKARKKKPFNALAFEFYKINRQMLKEILKGNMVDFKNN
jgi:hypothetical protein